MCENCEDFKTGKVTIIYCEYFCKKEKGSK